ncbi:MAG: tetratricopeptide repeat protein [Candidatus Riflebacteria bacterium]|nr:tetratricopeptide repeat protein [Candidatus Riflebacteria bacterium]
MWPVVLTEAVLAAFKILGLLLGGLLASFAGRIAWRSSGGKRWRMVALCLAATAVTIGGLYLFSCEIGWRINHVYGEEAFANDNFEGAVNLLEQALAWRDDLDTRARLARALIAVGDAERARALLEGNRLRRGEVTPFEAYYLGLLYLAQRRGEEGLRCLERAETDIEVGWNARLLLGIHDVDRGRADLAQVHLAPFAGMPPASPDHAYVAAAIAIANRRVDEAERLLASFAAGPLPPQWQARFQQLRQQLPR